MTEQKKNTIDDIPSIYSGMVMHCAATTPTMDIGVSEIRQWHLDRGWNDIGYHLVIRRDGTIENGRDMYTQGAHALHFNRVNGQITLGVCMAGGIDSAGNVEDNFTDAQWKSMYGVIVSFKNANPDAFLCGHHDLKGHESRGCPSFDPKKYAHEVMRIIGESNNPPENFMEEVDTGEYVEPSWEEAVRKSLGH